MTFAPRFIYGDLDLTDAPFMVEFGLDLGNAQAVTAVIDSLLTDGELISGERDSNREITLTVLVEGSDLAELADAEALLVAQARKQRNTLTVEPGDDVGPTTVFDTFRAQVEWQRDDDFERSNLRRFVLTIPALPFSHSLNPIVDNADTPPSDGGTLLYNCESTAGWSQYFSGGFGSPFVGNEHVVDGSVFSEGAGSIRSKPGYYYTYGPSGPERFGWADEISGLSLSSGAGGYVSISLRGTPVDIVLNGRTVSDNGIIMTSVENGDEGVTFFKTSRDAQGFVRYVWPVDAGLTITRLRFYGFQNQPSFTSQPYLWYDDLRLIGAATTDKRIIKQLTVKGSARTTGSLLIAAPDDAVALGRVMAVTAPTDALPAGYTPDGRRWATSGTANADGDAPSGSYFTPAAGYNSASPYPVFDVPAALFTPGAYAAVLSCKPSSGGSVAMGVQAQLLVDGVPAGVLSTAEQQPTVGALEYDFFPVGTLHLPPTPVLSPNADVRVRFLFKGSAIRLDDLYLIPAWSVGGRPVADFSIIDCGTGTVGVGGASSHLWLDSPSATQPQGGYWRGADASKRLAVSAWPDAKKPGLHTFQPGGLTAFVISMNAQGPRVELSYYPAWHGSAAI